MPDNHSIRSDDRSPRNEEYFYSFIRPEVEKTFSHEQREELRGVFKRIAVVPSKKIIDFRTSFWFVKRLYLVIFLGVDQRRQPTHDRWHTLALTVLKALVFLIIMTLLAVLIFSVLYLAKSAMGIDLFPERHLRDFIPGGQ